MSAKHYAWLLFDGTQWLSINNDHIIEANYCQPGAKGITIHSSERSFYIDFDDMTGTSGCTNFNVKREIFLSDHQREDVGWYYRDNIYWCEYGTGSWPSSVNSQDLEQRYNSNPSGSHLFFVGSTKYTIDFSEMMQTNMATQMKRNIRRRPKFMSTANDSQVTGPTLNPSSDITWEYLENNGVWMQYQKPGSSVDSVDIERAFKLNPQAQITFTAGRYSYTLDFSSMSQTNQTFGTRRSVRRMTFGNPYTSSTSSQVSWQFYDGSWKDFVQGQGLYQCTISSQDIEQQYQQNPSGSMNFSTRQFSYRIDFSGMIQTNLLTNTRKVIRRLQN